MQPKLDSQVIFLFTKDLERSHTFYTDILGLPLQLDQGKCRIYKIVENAYLAVCQMDVELVPEGIIITLVTQDVDGWYELLLERGVAFEKPPAYYPEYKIYHCFLRDPNGYLIEIQRFEDPRWE